MKPIEFDGWNIMYARHQPQYLQLPGHCDSEGVATFCWKLSFRERLKLLFSGRIWQRVLTFHQPLQPQKFDLDRPVTVPKRQRADSTTGDPKLA